MTRARTKHGFWDGYPGSSKNQRGLDFDINEQFVLKVKAPMTK